MPIYEYRCKDCKNEFEELVFSLEEMPPCPKCGSKKVEKLMSACATQTDSGMPDMPPMPSAGGCGSGGG